MTLFVNVYSENVYIYMLIFIKQASKRQEASNHQPMLIISIVSHISSVSPADMAAFEAVPAATPTAAATTLALV